MNRIQRLLEEALKKTLEESKMFKDISNIPGANRLDIRRLKDFAMRNLPEDSKLRTLILSERDELSIEEFLVKMGVWLRLLTLES